MHHPDISPIVASKLSYWHSYPSSDIVINESIQVTYPLRTSMIFYHRLYHQGSTSNEYIRAVLSLLSPELLHPGCISMLCMNCSYHDISYVVLIQTLCICLHTHGSLPLYTAGKWWVGCISEREVSNAGHKTSYLVYKRTRAQIKILNYNTYHNSDV